MLNDEAAIESEIQCKELTAPRVTPDRLQTAIKSAYFHRVPDSTMTICVLTLQNGYHVTGESACVSPENYNADMGETIAYNNAREKIWQLEGYLLQQKLWEGRAGVPA